MSLFEYKKLKFVKLTKFLCPDKNTDNLNRVVLQHLDDGDEYTVWTLMGNYYYDYEVIFSGYHTDGYEYTITKNKTKTKLDGNYVVLALGGAEAYMLERIDEIDLDKMTQWFEQEFQCTLPYYDKPITHNRDIKFDGNGKAYLERYYLKSDEY
jgi:hypothetical protein